LVPDEAAFPGLFVPFPVGGTEPLLPLLQADKSRIESRAIRLNNFNRSERIVNDIFSSKNVSV
jgi:hypothetical protein